MPKKRNQGVFVLEGGEVTEPVAATKLAETAEASAGVQALVINSSASARVVEIANTAGIPVVVATKSGGGKGGVEVYGVDELA